MASQQRPHPAAPWRPLGFFSRKLDATQVKYSAFDRELLACVSIFKQCRHMLEGRQFTIYADHKPLTYALSRTSDPWSARQARQLSYLAEHTADIWHIAGEENVVADMLSRPTPSAAANVKEPLGSLVATWQGGKPESSSPSMDKLTVCAVLAVAQKLDYTAIAANQRTCQTTLQAIKSSSLQLQAVEVMGVSLWCDVSTSVPHPLIPVQDRRAICSIFHSLAHKGTWATRRLLMARVVWWGMISYVAAWIRDCQQCCREK